MTEAFSKWRFGGRFGEVQLTGEHIFNGFGIKMVKFSGFVTIFQRLYLETQGELSKKRGHYEYLLLVKRSFLGSLVL